MSRQGSTAAKIIRLCNEILIVGRKDGTVGDYQRGCGPLGGGGRFGGVLDERWKALAEQFDALAEEISRLVRAIDPAYPVNKFYRADSEPDIAQVPGGRVRMSDHERESARDHMRWLYRGKTEEEIDSHLATFVTSMENLETARARARYSKPQWPGAVTLERDSTAKAILYFMSSPKTVCQFEERFKAVITWAETHLANEGAPIDPNLGQSHGAAFPWWRAILAIALLIVLEFFAVMGAWLWGDGHNPLQKIGNCWWLLAFVPTAAPFVFRLILGREGWSQVKKKWHSWRGEA